MRINKFLSSAGYCSRREADRLIAEGRVTVDGVPAAVGSLLLPGQKVRVDGNAVGAAEDAGKVRRVVLAVNKPRGVVCTAGRRDRAPNIVDLVDWPERVYPVGRLDKDSEGLILMTNDGDLAHRVTRTAGRHEKEYVVTVDRALTGSLIDRLGRGMYLKELDKSTLPCKVTKLDDHTFSIVLTQGLNRQIRRMCEACGLRVERLRRVRVMNVLLGHLGEGKWRRLDGPELEELRERLGMDR